jgi:general stress protein 26
MRIAAQLNASMALLAVRIRKMANTMLTGLDETNSLKSRPMTPLEIDSAGAIWFFADLRSTTVKRLAVLHLGFSDPATAAYVSISGHGELDVNRDHIEALWNPASIRWFPDGVSSPNLALLKFVPERAEYWDAAQSRMVRTFAPISAYVSGAQPAPARHRALTDLARQTMPRPAPSLAFRQQRYD